MAAIICLLAALCWSLAVIMLKECEHTANPVTLNLYKNTLGGVCLVATCAAMANVGWIATDSRDFWLLAVSGFFGIGVADAFVLAALKDLNATHLAILECMFPPMVVLTSVFYLGETVTLVQIAGIAIITAAVLLASINISRKAKATDGTQGMGQNEQDSAAAGSADRQKLLRGVSLMAMGLSTMAVGVVVAKPVIERHDIFLTSTIRMLFGIVSSIICYAVFVGKKDLLADYRAAPKKGRLLFACLMSSYVAYVLWLLGYKFNDASVAAILNSTSTLFTVLLATLILREKLTRKIIVATFLAIGGVILVTAS